MQMVWCGIECKTTCVEIQPVVSTEQEIMSKDTVSQPVDLPDAVKSSDQNFEIGDGNALAGFRLERNRSNTGGADPDFAG